MEKRAKQSKVFDAFRLDGKVAIVTGASQWLGWDAACALAEAGSDTLLLPGNFSEQRKLQRRFEATTHAMHFL